MIDLMVQDYSYTQENWVCDSCIWSFIHEVFMASGDRQDFFFSNWTVVDLPYCVTFRYIDSDFSIFAGYILL